MHGDGLVVERDGLENALKILLNIGRLGILEFVQAHALVGERVAVELLDQVHDAAHIAAVVQNEKKIGGSVSDDFGVLPHELVEDLAQFVDGDVFEEDQVEHDLVVRGYVVAGGLDGNGLMQGVQHLDYSINVALGYQSVAVDAQDHLQEIAGVQALGLPIGVDRHTAGQASGWQDQDVMQLAGQAVDHLAQGGVL